MLTYKALKCKNLHRSDWSSNADVDCAAQKLHLGMSDQPCLQSSQILVDSFAQWHSKDTPPPEKKNTGVINYLSI